MPVTTNFSIVSSTNSIYAIKNTLVAFLILLLSNLIGWPQNSHVLEDGEKHAWRRYMLPPPPFFCSSYNITGYNFQYPDKKVTCGSTGREGSGINFSDKTKDLCSQPALDRTEVPHSPFRVLT